MLHTCIKLPSCLSWMYITIMCQFIFNFIKLTVFSWLESISIFKLIISLSQLCGYLKKEQDSWVSIPQRYSLTSNTVVFRWLPDLWLPQMMKEATKFRESSSFTTGSDYSHFCISRLYPPRMLDWQVPNQTNKQTKNFEMLLKYKTFWASTWPHSSKISHKKLYFVYKIINYSCKFTIYKFVLFLIVMECSFSPSQTFLNSQPRFT